MKTIVSLYNVERTTRACLRALMNERLNIEVHDFGSADATVSVAKELINVTEHGKLSPADYTRMREELSVRHDKVFWVDGDEIWTPRALKILRMHLNSFEVVNGFWRNLKIEDDEFYVSEPTLRGAVAWNTDRYMVRRAWPRERLVERRDGVARSQEEISSLEVQCYHCVLLDLSSQPVDEARAAKRAQRAAKFASLKWVPIPEIPFDYE